MNLFRFPLKQHVGKEAVPIVTKGAFVQRGQLLAYPAPQALSVPIHSSVSGTVTDVSDTEILIETDTIPPTGSSATPLSGDYLPSEDYLPIEEMPPLETIRAAGIVGLGGAGFPTYAKLSTPLEHGTIVINAAECEPILCHNMARIRKSAPEIIRGLEIVLSLTKAEKGIIAIKELHTEEIACLQNAIGTRPIRLSLLPDLYPMGEERAILRETLGTLLPPDALPYTANAIVLNIETLFHIYEAVELRKPLIDKDLTVAGKISTDKEANLIQVLLDMPLGISTQALLETAGTLSPDYGELIAGGPFTGKRTTLLEPLIKTTGGILAAECFPKGPSKIGLLVCACGADEARLRQIAESLGSTVVGVEYCKQAKPGKSGRKCENPGKCPGQVQKVLALKKAGAQALLISNCTDCSNTVMSCAPQLALPVYHCTDQALRAVHFPLIRKIKS